MPETGIVRFTSSLYYLTCAVHLRDCIVSFVMQTISVLQLGVRADEGHVDVLPPGWQRHEGKSFFK